MDQDREGASIIRNKFAAAIMQGAGLTYLQIKVRRGCQRQDATPKNS